VRKSPLPPPSAPALARAPRSESSNGVTSLTAAALPPRAVRPTQSFMSARAHPLPRTRRTSHGNTQPGAYPGSVLGTRNSHRRGTLRVPAGRPSHVVGVFDATSPGFRFCRAWHLDPDPPTGRETFASLPLASSHASVGSIPRTGDPWRGKRRNDRFRSVRRDHAIHEAVLHGLLGGEVTVAL
jgi:hypothetical protein